jgi:hypothetical protein
MDQCVLLELEVLGKKNLQLLMQNFRDKAESLRRI